METGTEILKQLGGNKFIAMTGSKNFVAGDDSLMFNITRNKSKANKVRITLTPADTYTVEFIRIKNVDYDIMETYEGVYNDQLQELFTVTTGLDTQL